MRRLNAPALVPVLIVIALIGYFLPWVVTPATSLSLGAYDLAEWSSLHPVVRQTVPFLWTALALRIPLAILGILFAAFIDKTFHRKSVSIVCLLIATIALLPPLEFFTVYRDDPNYRQQFVIVLMTLLFGMAALFVQPKRLRMALLVVLSLIGLLSSAIGLYQAQSLVRGFEIPTTIGAGGIITAITFAVVAYLYTTKQSS